MYIAPSNNSCQHPSVRMHSMAFHREPDSLNFSRLLSPRPIANLNSYVSQAQNEIRVKDNCHIATTSREFLPSYVYLSTHDCNLRKYRVLYLSGRWPIRDNPVKCNFFQKRSWKKKIFLCSYHQECQEFVFSSLEVVTSNFKTVASWKVRNT